MTRNKVPVRAISKVPQIQMTPDEIDLGRIFLNYEMNSNVTLFNPSKTLRAVYNLSSFQNGQMTIDFNSPQGTGSKKDHDYVTSIYISYVLVQLLSIT